MTRWRYLGIAGSGSPSKKGLYPTTRVEAAGKDEARKTRYGYDFHTGAVTSVTDVDNGVKTLTELDDAGRPIVVRRPRGRMRSVRPGPGTATVCGG